MKPLRLGIYCPGTGSGGPWRYVHSLLAGLDRNNFEVTLFCDLHGVYEPLPWVKVIRLPHSGCDPLPVSQIPDHDLSRTQASKNRSLYQLIPPVLRLWAGFAKETRRLVRLFREHPVEVLHTQNTGCEESAVAAKLAGVRHVIGTFHVDSTYDLHRERSGPSHRMMEMLSNRCLDKAIAVSHAAKRDWIRRTHIPAGRVVTIHNGIDPEKFQRRHSREEARRILGLPTHGLIIGGLGRLDEAKGFTYLIEAAAMLRGEFPNLYVAIAGDGPLRKELEQKVEQFGLAGRVRFLGFLSNVQILLDTLDVFALPSLCETLGYALLEAMATELPAVGSTVGGIPEVILEGATGFLVPPRNPERLAVALRTLLRDNEMGMRMGIAGRERVIRHFHERDMVRKTIDLYRTTLSENLNAKNL